MGASLIYGPFTPSSVQSVAEAIRPGATGMKAKNGVVVPPYDPHVLHEKSVAKR
jgi:hypothetical protein